MTPETPAQQLARQFREAVELRLITLIEDIEGQVPTTEQMKSLGACAITPDGREHWTWRDALILTAYIDWAPGMTPIVLHSPPGILR